MKKILAIILTLCMMAGVLTSCGSMTDEQSKKVSFYEEIAQAIVDEDDDALEEIVAEIEEYATENFDNNEDLSEAHADYNDDKSKEMAKFDKLISDEDINSECVDALRTGLGYAEEYASTIEDAEELTDFYDELLEKIDEAYELGKDEDSAGIREIGNDLRDEYFEDVVNESKGYFEYEDAVGELYDEYGSNIMNAVMGVYSSACRLADEEAMENVDKKMLDCNLKIRELEEKYDF